MDTNRFMKVDKEWIEGDKMQLFLSSYLQRYRVMYSGNVKINLKTIMNYLGIKQNQTSRVNKLKSYFPDNNFANINDIQEIEFNADVLPERRYVIIYWSEMDYLFNSNIKDDKLGIFKVYCCIKGHCYDKAFCQITKYTIIKETQLSKMSVEKYLKILNDIGLILYDNIGLINLRGYAKNDTNIYVLGLYKDAQEILQILLQERRNEMEFFMV